MNETENAQILGKSSILFGYIASQFGRRSNPAFDHKKGELPQGACMTDNSILLGYEIRNGQAVKIPLRHLAVTGQTQESGKTTTLEALVSRSQRPAIAFVTKRGEKSFSSGHRVTPYFRDRADWQFVCSIIDATLQEKNKFLRPWIMRICRSTHTLADVQREVQTALKKSSGSTKASTPNSTPTWT
jgi:hypothetical protein